MFNQETVLNLSNQDTLQRLWESVYQPYKFSRCACEEIEGLINDTVRIIESGGFKEHTVDKAQLRNKYFFGERYTYGVQLVKKGPGMERLYPHGLIEPIPQWIHDYIINPLISANIVAKNFINSVVINDYQPGGCIVSHIDPPHIFERPIISVNLFSESALCFGCKFNFKPLRCSEPILRLPLSRGIVTVITGFAANEITHCVRPEDTKEHRAVIILRRVLPNAPRLNISEMGCIGKKTSNVPNELNGEQFVKFYKKYSKNYKSKKNSGGIFKRKTFFVDNRHYCKAPYRLKE